MRLSKEDFDNLRLLNGMCVISIPSLSSDEVAFNGTTIKIVQVKEEERAKQARRSGVLVKAPEKIPWVHGDMWRCDLDAKEGDEVFWEGFYTTEQIERLNVGHGQDMLIEVEDKIYITVPARVVVAAKREDKVIACNGYIIGEIMEPEEKVSESGLVYFGEVTELEKAHYRVKVHAVPKSLPEFKSPDKFKNVKVKEGDIVWVNRKYPVYLDKTYSATTDLVRFQSFTTAMFE